MEATDGNFESGAEDSPLVTNKGVPKLDIAAAIPVIQSFADTPEMSAQIVNVVENCVTCRSEASTLRELPIGAKLPSAKCNGSLSERSPEKAKLVLTPRSKIKLSDAFRNYQKSSFPSVRNLPPAKSAFIPATESSKNHVHDAGSSEFRKLNAALSKDGRRKFQATKVHSHDLTVSVSEKPGFSTEYRDLSLNTKRYLEAIDHMKSRDTMRLHDDKRRLAIARNEKHKSAVSGEDVEKFFHKATTLACASDSVYVRRDAAQAVATLMVSSLPSDVLMSQPESLAGMLDLFQSDKIDASVKLKVLNSFASIVEDDRYKVLTLQQHALFQRFLNLDHKRSKSFANGKAQVLSAMALTSDCTLKDEFQIQGGFNEICRMIDDARDVQTIENLISGLECLLCDPHDTKALHWTPSCIDDIVKLSSCDYPRIRIAALNGIMNCCRSIHIQVQNRMCTLREHCSHYQLLLSELDPIDFRSINPESIGEYMFRLKALRSLLSISNDPITTMREILPILLRFIRTNPECLQHEATLAARKAITSDQMFGDNLTIRLALARLIRPGPLVVCPKNFKTISGSLEKSGANSARRVTMLDSDLTKGKKVSENLSPRIVDAFSSNSFNKAKAEEITEGENIASHILAQALEILSQIFNQGNAELRSIFASPEIHFSDCLETIIIFSSSSKIHKEAGTLLCDFGKYTLSEASSGIDSPFSRPRFLQTLCGLLAANDLSLCERVLQFLLFQAIEIRSTRELIRSIGISDLLRNLSQRSGSLRIHAYTAILLTHLCMPEDVHASDLASVWLKELHAVATLMGSKTKEAESLSSFQGIMNFLSKEKKIIGLIGGGWFKSSLKMILPWMRQITLEDVSNGFDKQRKRICADIVNIIKMDFCVIANHARARRWLVRVRASIKRRDQLQREKDDPKFFIQSDTALPASRHAASQ